MKASLDPEYSDAFKSLMRAAKVSMVHLAPKNTASIAAAITAQTSDVLRGLAKAYGVMPRDIIRAALVIGLEELLGCAEDLGHASQDTAD